MASLDMIPFSKRITKALTRVHGWVCAFFVCKPPKKVFSRQDLSDLVPFHSEQVENSIYLSLDKYKCIRNVTEKLPVSPMHLT